ncbi:MAG: hypothetical protein KDA58_15675 [Planctomycetaceae bacterium]|nr:hypothetical protein [Planctomycetaceae bacterium]
MKRWMIAALAAVAMTRAGLAQDFVGAASVGSNEPLFSYDDQEHWKHGWMQDMPYYGGFETFRPYNYHHVFGQATTAQGWGMSMPYSQQFWHRYEHLTNLNQTAPGGEGYQQAVPQPQYSGTQYYGTPQPMLQNSVPQQQLMQPIPQPSMQPIPQSMPQIIPQQGYQGAQQMQYVQPASPQQQQMLNYLNGPALPRNAR